MPKADTLRHERHRAWGMGQGDELKWVINPYHALLSALCAMHLTE